MTPSRCPAPRHPGAIVHVCWPTSRAPLHKPAPAEAAHGGYLNPAVPNDWPVTTNETVPDMIGHRLSLHGAHRERGRLLLAVDVAATGLAMGSGGAPAGYRHRRSPMN